MSRHFDVEQAAGIAALPEDDPDRVAAYRQAAHDPPLRRALDESEQLMALLGEVTVEPPTAEALERAAQAVLAEMDAARPASWLASASLAAAVLASWGAMLLLSRSQLPAAGADLASSTLMALVAAVAAGGIARVGGLLTSGAVIFAGVLFAASGSGRGGLGPVGEGLHCALITLLAAAPPLAIAVGLLLRRRPVSGDRSPWWGAGVAASGALGGIAALHLSCTADAIGHMLLFHAGGVVLAALAGYAVARFVYSVTDLSSL